MDGFLMSGKLLSIKCPHTTVRNKIGIYLNTDIASSSGEGIVVYLETARGALTNIESLER